MENVSWPSRCGWRISPGCLQSAEPSSIAGKMRSCIHEQLPWYHRQLALHSERLDGRKQKRLDSKPQPFNNDGGSERRGCHYQGEPPVTGAAVRTVCAIVLFAALISCNFSYHPKTRDELQSLARQIHEKFPDTEVTDEGQEKASQKTLTNLGLGNLSANDLSELRSIYAWQYLEPRIDDSATEGIARIIKSRIGKAIKIRIDSGRYEPFEVYVIDSFNPKTYQSHLENGYADDSIYIPEFPESYDNRAISYQKTSRFQIELEKPFALVVEPHFYLAQSWRVGNVIENGNTFLVPQDLRQDVLFMIIADKGNPNRQYKVLWVIDFVD